MGFFLGRVGFIMDNADDKHPDRNSLNIFSTNINNLGTTATVASMCNQSKFVVW